VSFITPPPVCQQVAYEAGADDVIQQLAQQGQMLLCGQRARVMLVQELSSGRRCNKRKAEATQTRMRVSLPQCLSRTHRNSLSGEQWVLIQLMTRGCA